MKRTKLLLLLLCLTLAACGGGPTEPASKSSSSEPAGSVPAASQGEASVPEPDSSEPPLEEPLLPLTQEELTAVHQAAHDYYRDTVFENIVLTEVVPREGEISFRVSCTKGGKKVDPDRFISLERRDGVWTVINEGY